METVCSQCGVTITGAQVFYTAQGAAVCHKCNVQGEIKESERRAAENAPTPARSAFLSGFVYRSILIVIVILAVLIVMFIRRRVG